MNDALISEAYVQALDLLRRVATPHGYLATPTEHANYRRVWARDGIVCGLAGLASGDEALADTLRATLETLATEQGPQGQIPSNVVVGPDGMPERVSYGGLAGRVDPIPWFVLGVARYTQATGDQAFLRRMHAAVEESLALLEAWEFNGRGLVYVPQSGNWADEYDLHGYLLYDQILRLAALEAWSPYADRPLDLERLERLVRVNYWPEAEPEDEALIYHPHAFRRFVARQREVAFPMAAFSPGGYAERFDAWGSAIALALGIAFHDPHARRLLDYAEALRAETAAHMLPAFWPPVDETAPAWAGLAENYHDAFTNKPGHYHNGGCWPVANGWWGLALVRHGRTEAAAELLEHMAAFCRLDEGDGEWGFFEYSPAYELKPSGVRHLAWSAAGVVMLHQALREADTPVPEMPRSGPIVAEMPRYDAVVAGELLVDLISTEEADRLDDAHGFSRFPGGSAANLAGNLARLGRSVVFVGAVGDDGFGRFLQQELACSGLELRVAERLERPTTQITITRGSGTADFAAHRGADRLLRPEQLPDSLLANTRLFHTTGFALAREPARSVLLDAARRAVRQGAVLSVDLNIFPQTERARRRDQEALRILCGLGALVKCSVDDLGRLFGDDKGAEERIALLHGWGAPLVAYTRGADGTLVSWDGGHAQAEIPALPVEVQDATGAGDAFWAGFLTAWFAGHGPPRCAEAGSRLAALKLTRVGPLPDRINPETLYTQTTSTAFGSP